MQHEQLIQLLRAALRRSQSSEWHNDDIQPSMRKKYDGDLLGNNIESIIETLEVLKPKEDSQVATPIAGGRVTRLCKFLQGQDVYYIGRGGHLKHGIPYVVQSFEFDRELSKYIVKVSDPRFFNSFMYVDEDLLE